MESLPTKDRSPMRGAMLVDAVVVAGNYPGANVRSSAHVGVAQVGKVVGFCALAELGLFGFDKVTYVGIFANLALRPQMRERADLRAVHHLCFQ